LLEKRRRAKKEKRRCNRLRGRRGAASGDW
jgi:hypothetical protein